MYPEFFASRIYPMLLEITYYMLSSLTFRHPLMTTKVECVTVVVMRNKYKLTNKVDTI